MPLVKIEMIRGKTGEYKKTYLQAVHDALVEGLGIPDNDRIQRLYEVDKEFFELSGHKTDKFALIELTLFPGRRREVKRRTIQAINRLLAERLGIQPADIFVVINDPPLENWGLRGDQASELGLRYDK